jgi:DNA end-binding protein Ku
MAATVWKGYLSFGLVSFPIRLFTAARRKPVHFHMLHRKDLSRIKEVWYCAAEDRPVDRSDIVKGYEYGKDEYVVVEDTEIKKAAPTTAEAIEILQFVKADEVDPIFLDQSYYVRPEEKVHKPYSLFLVALKETKYHAIARVAMHGREHIAVIRPAFEGLVLHTLYYSDELHKANEAAENGKSNLNRKEMDLAKKLIESLAAPFKPGQFHDRYRENLEHLIEQKQHGRKVTVIKHPKTAPVVNIVEALQRSLAASKPAKKRSRTAA